MAHQVPLTPSQKQWTARELRELAKRMEVESKSLAAFIRPDFRAFPDWSIVPMNDAARAMLERWETA